MSGPYEVLVISPSPLGRGIVEFVYRVADPSLVMLCRNQIFLSIKNVGNPLNVFVGVLDLDKRTLEELWRNTASGWARIV